MGRKLGLFNLSSNIHSSEDAQILALRRLPELISGFIEGGTGREHGIANNLEAFKHIKLQSRVLKNIDNRSIVAAFLGQTYDVPFGIAPMGMCNVVHPKADRFLAELAKSRKMPLVVSTASSTEIEELHTVASECVWFQLYVLSSIEHSFSLVKRVKASGCKTLVLTVDVPQPSRRIRDLRSGFKVDFRLGPRQIYDLAKHPIYSLRMLLAGQPTPAHFTTDGVQFDRNASRSLANWDFLKKLREFWTGHLIVKGVLSVPDAQQIKNIGADAIWVSNHGGRQLDSAPAAISILPHIRDALGPAYPLILDSGVRGGEDILKALVCGANFVMLGRPWLYAIGAEGDKGLQNLLQALSVDLSIAMAQIGVRSIKEIGRQNLVGFDKVRGVIET